MKACLCQTLVRAFLPNIDFGGGGRGVDDENDDDPSASLFGFQHVSHEAAVSAKFGGGLGSRLFPNYFPSISYSISYSYYLFIFPEECVLPIHFGFEK